MFGEIDKIYLASNNNPDVAEYSTSGGFIKGLVCLFIDNGFKAIIARMNGTKVETIITSDKSDILTTATNSCYQENKTFHKIIKQLDRRNQYVAVGLPCQIKMLSDYSNIIKVSLICNHEPKKEYTDWLLNKNGKKSAYEIVYRTGNPSETYCLIDGEKSKYYWTEEFKPEKCKKCRLIGEDADFVCGDPWGLNVRNKTLVISRNIIATSIIEIAEDYVKATEITKKELEKSQYEHFKRKSLC